jgi:peptide deformylase
VSEGWAQRIREMAVLSGGQVPLLPVLPDTHPCLRVAATEVLPEEADAAKLLARAMLRTMVQHRGIGLAAPQVGVSRRLVVFAVKDGTEVLFGAVQNPVVTWRYNQLEGGREGCLSMPGKFVFKTRHKRVKVEGVNPDNGEPVRLEARGLLARVLQHEIDHLDGVLMTDPKRS